jgi:hypothetical protein
MRNNRKLKMADPAFELAKAKPSDLPVLFFSRIRKRVTY